MVSESSNCSCVNQSIRNSEQFCEKNGTNFKWREFSQVKGNTKKMQMTILILGPWENAWVSANRVCSKSIPL